ncbi:hypothetical protein M405DRAFT_822381 [Rhizopogon salebrosus TDB-379]|jgi:hypothetical protein|nr:hypothetical protein M405DRAFT_822381 [Rhizopogon salebrosus TDB-379]
MSKEEIERILKPGIYQSFQRRCGKLISINKLEFTTEVILAASTPPMWFTSPFFARKLIAYLEGDPDRRLDRGWVWVYALGQFACLVVG